MMGVEPIQQALTTGAQVIVAGRSSDTSIFAALPLLEGCDPAVVWHMAKILECGAAAVAVRTAPDCMMAVLHEDSFDVFPLREDYRCTPQSVASHTVYENADPFELKEPSGTLRTNKARYEAISDRAVRVSGSEFVHDPEYTIKLEGVREVGYSTILMGGVRDPYILTRLDSWLARLDDNIRTRIRNTVGERAYEIVTRVYGCDGVMGALEPHRGSVGGHEAFILWDVISESQELSRTIATSLSHLAVHNPIPKWHGLISGVAFPYSPPEIDRGPVYEFHLNHVLVPDRPPCSARNTRSSDHGDARRPRKIGALKERRPVLANHRHHVRRCGRLSPCPRRRNRQPCRHRPPLRSRSGQHHCRQSRHGLGDKSELSPAPKLRLHARQ
jgi:hypothetical protein